MKTYSWLNQNRLLSHVRTTFCALGILGVSTAFPSSAADRAGRAVSTPVFGSGEFLPCFSYAGPPRPVGENVIINFNIGAEVTGTFNGSLTGVEMDVVHPDGSITLHGSALFTGSYNGGPEGTLIYTYEGIGNVINGHETLHAVARQGTGGLAGMVANVTAEGDLIPPPPPPGCDGDFGGHGTYNARIVLGR